MVAVTWMFIFQPQYGIVNYLLNLGDYSVLGSPKTAMLGVVISGGLEADAPYDDHAFIRASDRSRGFEGGG